MHRRSPADGTVCSDGRKVHIFQAQEADDISRCAMGTSWMFLYEAYFRIGVGIASLLYYCGPVIVMVLSPLVFGEKLTGYKIAGFLSVLIGVVMLNGTAQGGSDPFGIL